MCSRRSGKFVKKKKVNDILGLTRNTLSLCSLRAVSTLELEITWNASPEWSSTIVRGTVCHYSGSQGCSGHSKLKFDTFSEIWFFGDVLCRLTGLECSDRFSKCHKSIPRWIFALVISGGVRLIDFSVKRVKNIKMPFTFFFYKFSRSGYFLVSTSHDWEQWAVCMYSCSWFRPQSHNRPVNPF